MVMIVLVIVWTLAFGLGAIFLCGAHPKNAWAPVAVVAEKCSAQLTFLEGYAISDFIMDVIIWALPHPKVRTVSIEAFSRVYTAMLIELDLGFAYGLSKKACRDRCFLRRSSVSSFHWFYLCY